MVMVCFIGLYECMICEDDDEERKISTHLKRIFIPFCNDCTSTNPFSLFFFHSDLQEIVWSLMIFSSKNKEKMQKDFY